MNPSRVGAHLLILLVLWGQLSFSLHLENSAFFDALGTRIPLYFDWSLFTPTVKHQWRVRYYALESDGSEVLLPLPNQSERSFLERHFLDFSETMLQSNLFSFSAHEVYAKQLCRVFGQGERNILAIRVTSSRRRMLEPEQARARETFFEPETHVREIGTYQCES